MHTINRAVLEIQSHVKNSASSSASKRPREIPPSSHEPFLKISIIFQPEYLKKIKIKKKATNVLGDFSKHLVQPYRRNRGEAHLFAGGDGCGGDRGGFSRFPTSRQAAAEAQAPTAAP